MPDSLIVRTTADEFFAETFIGALHQERVEVSALTLSYVVDLLVRQMLQDAYHPSMPLSDQYLAAMRERGRERARILRQVGDYALMISGAWSRYHVGPLRVSNRGLYINLGQRAYDSLGGAPYSEMADHFRDLVQALIHLSDTHAMATPAGILRLYSLWEQTHSWYIARLLAEHGITVGAPSRERS